MVDGMGGGKEIRYLSAGVELFAYSWGVGQPLILLHGSGRSWVARVACWHVTLGDLGSL